MPLTETEMLGMFDRMLRDPEQRERLRRMATEGLRASRELTLRMPKGETPGERQTRAKLCTKYRGYARGHLLMLRMVRNADLGVFPS